MSIPLPVPRMAITPTQFLAIADNVAQIILDLSTAHIINAAPTHGTVQNGLVGATNSMSARIAALSSADKTGQLGIQWRKAISAIYRYTVVSKADLYPFFKELLEGLDFDLKGVAAFVALNNLYVHPEFAAAFNWMADNGRVLGLHPLPIPHIPPSSVSLPAEQVLGSIAVTGATTGTFSSGTAIDQTQYAGPLQMYVKNTGGALSTGTATVFTVTYKNATNGANQTGTVTLSGALAAGARLAIGTTQGVSVSNITVTAGANGDNFAVVVEPDHTVSY